MPHFGIRVPVVQHVGYTHMIVFFVRGNEQTHKLDVPLPFEPAWLESELFFLSKGSLGSFVHVQMSSPERSSKEYKKEVSSLVLELCGDDFEISLHIFDQDGPMPQRLRIFCTLCKVYEISTDMAVYRPSMERYEVCFADKLELLIKCGSHERTLKFNECLAVITVISGQKFCLIARIAAPKPEFEPVFQIQASGAKFFLFSEKRLTEAVFLRLENESIEQSFRNVRIISETEKNVYFPRYPANLVVYTFPNFSVIDMTEIIVNGDSGTWELCGCNIAVEFLRPRRVEYTQIVRKRTANSEKGAQITEDMLPVELPKFVSVIDQWEPKLTEAALLPQDPRGNKSSGSEYKPLGLSVLTDDESVASSRRIINKSVLSSIDKTMEILGEKTRDMDQNLRKLQSIK